MMAAKDCIKNARFKLGLSQREFADLVNVSNTSISLYEIGERVPSFRVIRRIVDFLRSKDIEIEYRDLREK